MYFNRTLHEMQQTVKFPLVYSLDGVGFRVKGVGC